MRVILVDDEPIILEELQLILEGNPNIEVAGAYTDPLQVLRDLPVTKPDCAFLDIEMNGLSGIELAERLAAISPDIEVLFVTAYNNYAAQAFELNAVDYLLKPLRPERVNRAVWRLQKKRNDRPTPRGTGCRIKCFGTFEVLVGQARVTWSRSKSRELLAYLLQHAEQGLPKYTLCDEQWPDYGPEQALACLQTSIYALRKSLRDAGCTEIKIAFANDRYLLKLTNVDWDSQRFDQQYQVFQRSGSLTAAQDAAALYRGEYLAGEDWPWADISRESYARKFRQLRQSH